MRVGVIVPQGWTGEYDEWDPSVAWGVSGQVAIVTGAARGIGAEIARLLAAAGATVVVADLDVDLGTAVAAELGASFETVDVTDVRSVDGLVDRVLAGHGRIDILVKNAGIVRNTPAEDMPDEEWRIQFGVNSDGVFWCCRAIGRVMLARGSGSIVNIASISGLIANHPQPQAAYNASKAAVIMLTRSLASESVEELYGSAALAPMASWLYDPRLGARQGGRNGDHRADASGGSEGRRAAGLLERIHAQWGVTCTNRPGCPAGWGGRAVNLALGSPGGAASLLVGRGERRQATLRHLNVPANLPLEIEVTGVDRWLRRSIA